MPPTPRAAEPAPVPDDNTGLGARLDTLEARLDEISTRLEAIAQLELPSPAALEELSLRLDALEERPERVDYGQDDDDRPERRAPQQKICPECHMVDGVHTDDCELGLGDDALPKTMQERATLERRQEATR